MGGVAPEGPGPVIGCRKGLPAGGGSIIKGTAGLLTSEPRVHEDEVQLVGEPRHCLLGATGVVALHLLDHLRGCPSCEQVLFVRDKVAGPDAS